MLLLRRSLSVVLALFVFGPGVLAGAQDYTSIVVFGDSLSDVGNDAMLSAAKYTVAGQLPGPIFGYTDGRFTDGLDTVPAALNYRGVWIEQLAAKLAAKPVLTNSLAGGTDYAYGYGTTDVGTSVLSYPPGLSITVNNMGQQVTDYLATSPVITNKTLFVVWGGANDLLSATTPADIANAAAHDAGIVQRLIAAGATEFLVPNLPPLGLIPRLNGSPAMSVPATQAAAGFDQALAAALAGLPAANPGKTLHIFPLDVYTLFNTVVGPPIGFGLANVTASSQGKVTVNPDTYLFWDDLHPTTYGHSLIASTAFTLLGTPVTTTTTVGSSNLAANLGSSVTFTATVTGASGIPMGTVAFMDGATVIGSGLLSGTTTAATATFSTTTLTAGTHSITAAYAGVNGYTGSTSAAISEVVTAPSFTYAFGPTMLTIPQDASGADTITVTPVGGYSGTVTFACGTLPAHFSCSFSSPSVTLSGDNKPVTTIMTLGTAAVAAMTLPALPGAAGERIVAALTVFPCLGLVGIAALRRRRAGLMLVVVLSAVAALGLSGCGGSGTTDNHAAKGTYMIPITITANGGTTSTTFTVVVN